MGEDQTHTVAPQLSVVSVIGLKLWAKSETHPKMAYTGNTLWTLVFIADFSDECPIAVWTILQAWVPISRLHTLVQTYPSKKLLNNNRILSVIYLNTASATYNGIKPFW